MAPNWGWGHPFLIQVNTGATKPRQSQIVFVPKTQTQNVSGNLPWDLALIRAHCLWSNQHSHCDRWPLWGFNPSKTITHLPKDKVGILGASEYGEFHLNVFISVSSHFPLSWTPKDSWCSRCSRYRYFTSLRLCHGGKGIPCQGPIFNFH